MSRAVQQPKPHINPPRGDAAMEKQNKPDIEQLVFCRDIHEMCVNAMLRAVRNGTWKPAEHDENENQGEEG